MRKQFLVTLNFPLLFTLLAFGLFGLSISPTFADEGVTIANGKAKFDAILQVWFVNDTSLTNQTNGSGQVNNTKLNMFVRRAAFQFSGELTEETHWNLVADPANANTTGNSSILQEVEIEQELFNHWALTVGQMKQITLAESLESDATLVLPERSMVARTWGENWGQGAMLTYKKNAWKVAAQFTNDRNIVGDNLSGTSSNESAVFANNHNPNSPNSKDLTVRADLKATEMFSAGVFSYFPATSWAVAGAYGGNIKMMPIEDLVLRVEGVRGWVYGSDGTLARNGWAADAAYQYGNWQPVIRYEMQQQNTPGTTNIEGVVTGTAFTLGLNYYMKNHYSKIQLGYTKLASNTSGSNAPSIVSGSNFNPATGNYSPVASSGGSLVILAMQVAI